MCGSIKVEEMAILMSFLEPAQLAELKRRAATTLLKSTNASVTSGVAQAVEVHTIQTNTSQDTVKVKGGVVGKRKSFPASHSDAKVMKKSNPVVTASNPNPFCNSCGKTHANANTAMCRSVINKHPNVNLDRGPDGNLVPWAKSTMGTRLRACGMSYIHNNFQVDKQHVKTDWKQPVNNTTYYTYNLSMCNYSHTNTHLRAMLGADSSLGQTPSLRVMFDSGASANFIRKSCLVSSDIKACSPLTITLADNRTISSCEYFICNEFIISHFNNKITLQNLKFIVMDTLPFDVIIGLPTIRENRLTIKFPEYWGIDHPPGQVSTLESSELSLMHPTVKSPVVQSPTVQPVRTLFTFTTDPHTHLDQCLGDDCGQDMPVRNGPPAPAPSGCSVIALAALQMDVAGPASDSMYNTHTELNIPVRVNKSEVLGDVEYDDGIPDTANSLPTYIPQESDKALEDRVFIDGPDDMQALIRAWIRRHDIAARFATTTSKFPGKLNPMEFEVDEASFQNPRLNRQPCRRQSLQKDLALKEFLDRSIADGIIEPSEYPFWSQVFMVEKKTGKYRICIDYRNLNAATRRKDWPIPRIDVLLQRIGAMRAKYFAVFDLTSGYYQCPISRKYTTFTTPYGLFQWNRLPMGPTNAPAHFHKEMVSTVFWREIHRILEIYLDDLIVYGKTKEEFMSNLDITFRRLSEHQLTINPDKCKIGVSSVEYLGHTIDEHGLRFTPEKLTKVVQFKTPANQKEMKSFLGLCTYFHEHVPHFSTLASPLHASVWDYSPKRPIKWTPELSSAFETLKQAVYNCETLYFPQPEGTFIVESDASMLGMGAALFQEIKDVTAPSGIRRNAIAFLSQAFTPTQQRWSTIEQEGYAIYHAITSWRHFLEGTHFVLKTDHRNLSFIDKSEQSKVRRWKIDLQQFNFDIEWIPGDTNMVADANGESSSNALLACAFILPRANNFWESN